MGIKFINKDWEKSLTPGRTNAVVTGFIQTGTNIFEAYDKPVDSLILEITMIDVDYGIIVPLYKHFVADLGRTSELTVFIEGCLGHKLKASEMKSFDIEDLIMLPISVNIVEEQQENGEIFYDFTDPLSTTLDIYKIGDLETITYIFDVNGFEDEALDRLPQYSKDFILKSQEYVKYLEISQACTPTVSGKRENRRRTPRRGTQPNTSNSARRRRSND